MGFKNGYAVTPAMCDIQVYICEAFNSEMNSRIGICYDIENWGINVGLQ